MGLDDCTWNSGYFVWNVLFYQASCGFYRHWNLSGNFLFAARCIFSVSVVVPDLEEKIGTLGFSYTELQKGFDKLQLNFIATAKFLILTRKFPDLGIY